MAFTTALGLAPRPVLFSAPTLRLTPPTFRFGLPSITLGLTLPSITLGLAGLLESILKAVPKKKKSYSKKRMRQLAGKALQDVIALNRCSACGRMKRAHVLCVYCVQRIREMWAGKGAKTSGEESSENV